MSKGDIPRAMEHLGHIAEAIDGIHRYVEDLTELAFLEVEKTIHGDLPELRSQVAALMTS